MAAIAFHSLLLRVLLLRFDGEEVDAEYFLELLDGEEDLVDDCEPRDHTNEKESLLLIEDWLWVFAEKHVESIETDQHPA